MTATSVVGISAAPASHVLGRKLDSIPFSVYHIVLIVVLGFVAFIEGYDRALGLAPRAGQSAAAPHSRRGPLACRRTYLRGRSRRLRSCGDVGSRQSFDGDADRRDPQYVVHSAYLGVAEF